MSCVRGVGVCPARIMILYLTKKNGADKKLRRNTQVSITFAYPFPALKL